MTGKTILITRSAGDDAELRDALQARGHHVIHEPLTEIFLNHTVRHAIHHTLASEPDAVIVTSRYGVRALAALSDIRDIALLCVGDATAEVAQSLGYTRVCATGKTVEDMVSYLLDAYDYGAHFLYASAAHIRADIGETLKEYGMTVQRVVIYEAMASQALSDTLIEQLRRGQVDAVLFLSERSADIFRSLLEKTGIAEASAGMDAYCLSPAIAASLSKRAWKRIIVSDEPTLASIVASVDNAAS